MTRFLFGCLLALLLAPAVAFGDGGPAVSDPNAKLSLEGGQYDNDQSYLALGSYTLPLGHSFGLQADGAFGRFDQDNMGGAGLHLFARDPSSYLLGVYGSYHTWNSINIWRTGAEFQLYVQRFSIDGLAGYEGICAPDTVGGLAVLDGDDNHAFGQVDVGYYPVDDLKIYIGYRNVDETNLGGAGIEYLMRGAGSPISLFARGDFGDEQLNRVTGGLRVYLGSDPGKSLIERHRTEDPENYTPKFRVLRTQPQQQATLPQCTITEGDQVTSPTNGQCICPTGTPFAGSQPIFSGFAYFCGP